MQVELDPVLVEKIKKLREKQKKLIPEGQQLVSITGQVNMMLRIRVDQQLKDFEK